MTRNSGEYQSNLIFNDSLNQNFISGSDKNLDLERKNAVDRGKVKQLVMIFTKIAED